MRIQAKSYHWVYFCVQPFYTLIFYLVNFRNSAAKNIVWAFTVYFAMTIAVGSESQSSDIVRYMNDVKQLYNSNFTIDSAIRFYHESGEVDFLRSLLAIIVSRVTGNGYILVIVFGVIFGYFFSRNMWYILDRVHGKLKPVSIVLIFCLFLVVPIWTIGGFRYYVAVHVFLYGLLPYFFEKKKRKLIWCYITPFVFHYAFIFPALVLTLYLVAGNRVTIYFYFFIASLFVSGINISQFNNVVDTYAPASFAERSKSYRNEDKVQAFRAGENSESTVWYAKYKGKFLLYPIYAFLIVLYWKYRDIIKNNRKLFGLFCFTLLFYGFATLLSSLPSGGRFLSPADIMALSTIIIFVQNFNQTKLLSKLIKFSIPLLLIFIIIELRESWYFTSLFTLIGNPIASLFTIGGNVSLNDIIK